MFQIPVLKAIGKIVFATNVNETKDMHIHNVMCHGLLVMVLHISIQLLDDICRPCLGLHV